MIYYLLALEIDSSYLVKIIVDNLDGTSLLQTSWFYTVTEAMTHLDRAIFTSRGVHDQYDLQHCSTYTTALSLDELASKDFPELLL